MALKCNEIVKNTDILVNQEANNAITTVHDEIIPLILLNTFISTNITLKWLDLKLPIILNVRLNRRLRKFITR